MNANPMETLTINAKQTATGWQVECPQWKCTIQDKSLTRAVALLCAEVEQHNDECNGIANKELEELMGRLKPEHRPKKAASNWGRTIPDNGAMTPNRNINAW